MTEVKLSDSMSTIQKKLNKGGDIVFQGGIYKITQQLIIPADTTLHLVGATLKRCGNIQSIFLNKCKTSTTGYKGAGNITIWGGTLEGMGSYNHDNLLTFFHSHDIKVIGVKFLDTLCHAVELNACKDVEIENCQFFGNNAEEEYQEMIQIDSAYAVGFWLSGSSKKSKCYDGTPCMNVTIIGCKFDKSDYRTYPKACIGTHTQLYQGEPHRYIKILQNYFNCQGGVCLSLIGMSEVSVFSNYFTGASRIARVYNKDYSYKLDGTKVKPTKADGVCQDIKFKDNILLESYGDKPCPGIYAKALEDPHEGIEVVGNKFDKTKEADKYYLYTVNCKDVLADNNKTKMKKKIL